MKKILKVLNYQPADIQHSDLEDPLSAISYFFEDHPLHESRAMLWKLYEGWIRLASESPDGEELKAMMFFYNQLVELLNLCYIIKEKASKDTK